MKKKSLSQPLYSSKHFLTGVGFASLALLLVGVTLHSTGYLQLGSNNLSNYTTYANSLSPRKTTPVSTYTRPTPDPTAPDQTPPTISFISPLNGSNVDTSLKSGAYYVQPLTLAAQDDDRIMVVYLFVNDILDGIHVYNGTSYQLSVRVPAQAGTYTIKALAYDYNNNEGAASVSLTVPGRSK